jgi:MFS transporter, ACS family, tartrate transporter
MDVLILPVLWLVRLFSVIDRCNLMFASMQMQRDLRFDNLVYGTGAGLFFAGCSLFQLPSTLILSRISVPYWLGMQCLAFGIISAAFSLVQSATSFYLLRYKQAHTSSNKTRTVVLRLAGVT